RSLLYFVNVLSSMQEWPDPDGRTGATHRAHWAPTDLRGRSAATVDNSISERRLDIRNDTSLKGSCLETSCLDTRSITRKIKVIPIWRPPLIPWSYLSFPSGPIDSYGSHWFVFRRRGYLGSGHLPKPLNES